MPVSPKPGCSRDFDLLENSQTSETELHKQVIEIQEFLENITYVKIRELIRNKENFKRDLLQLFGDASLKRNGDGDICDVERKKLTVQITSVDGPIKMEKSKKKVPVPEALLDGLSGIKKDDQKLTPPQRGAKRVIDTKIPRAFPLDLSSDDEAISGGDNKSKKSGSNSRVRNNEYRTNQNKIATGAIPKQMREIKEKPAIDEPVQKKKLRARDELYPRRVVSVADVSKLPRMHRPAPHDEKRGVPGIKKEPAIDEPVQKKKLKARDELYPRRVVPVADVLKLPPMYRPASHEEKRGVPGIKKEPAGDEPVQKKKMRAHDEIRTAAPAGNLSEIPRLLRRPKDVPLRAHGEHQHDRWNPVFPQHNRLDNQANDENVNQAIIQAQLRNDFTLRVEKEANRQIKKEPRHDNQANDKNVNQAIIQAQLRNDFALRVEMEANRQIKKEPRHDNQANDKNVNQEIIQAQLRNDFALRVEEEANRQIKKELRHDNQANDKNVNQAIIQAQLRNDFALRVEKEANRQIKKEPRHDEQYDLPRLPTHELQLPANNGVDLPPRPELDILPPRNGPKIPIVNGNGAQVQPQVPAKVKDGYCQEIYTKLRAMFPNIKSDYIKNIIPADWDPNTRQDVQFGLIVEELLAAEATWELEVPENNPADLIGAVGGAGANENPRTIDETYEYLLELFPRADPTYLRTHAERINNNDQALEEFIEQTLKKHDYPTREQYMSQMRMTEERLRYTDNFTVQSFLEKFPDPFEHFLDNKRKCDYDLMAFEFLKCHFNKIRVNTISRIYDDSGWNMSITASKLLEIGSDMKSTRYNAIMPPKDINLLREMAFVRHQSELRDYIAKIKEAEKLEFEKLKKSNGLLECQCCYDSECLPSECSTCEIGHIFCNSCIISGTDSKLGEDETHVACFQSCGSEFSLATLQKILKPAKFSILVEKRQAAEVAAAGLEGLVACPFCHFATIPPEGDKVFRCLNPECMKESCIQCKEPNHVPLRCDEVGKTDKARKYIEEKMTQALARTCYKCNRTYFKEEGCNKITCPCGAIMCYLCNEKIKDYTHFRGQGSDDMSKCPIFSDNARLNAENVHKVADEAKKELLKQDPALNIDTEYLLPKIPPPSAGPHEQILQAPVHPPVPNQAINQLPEAQNPR